MKSNRTTILYVRQPGLLAQAITLSRRLGDSESVAVAEGRFIKDVSLPAIEAGICVGESVTRARRLCPMLLVVLQEEVGARKLSHRFYNALASISPVVEPAGSCAAYAELQDEQEADLARARLAQLFPQLPPAALATSFSKLAAQAIAESNASTLADVPVAPYLYPGDPKTLERLLRLGLSTFGAVEAIGESALTYQFGRKLGTVLHRRAQGISDDSIRSLWPPQEILADKSFTLEPIEDRGCLEFWLKKLSGRASKELTQSGKIARKLNLRVKTEASSRSRSWLTPWPLTNESEVHQAAIRLLAILRPDAPVVQLALTVSELELPTAKSLSLFAPTTAENLLRLESAKRLLNERYGTKALTTLGKVPLSQREKRRSKARDVGALA